ncbi:MAG: hypothetical protein ACE5KS_00355, partial [Woeseiaceae bacterium]
MSQIAEMMDDLGRRAKQAAADLSLCPGSQRNHALQAAANAIRANADVVLDANQAPRKMPRRMIE